MTSIEQSLSEIQEELKKKRSRVRELRFPLKQLREKSAVKKMLPYIEELRELQKVITRLETLRKEKKKRQTGATKMKFLRSPAVHNLALEPFSLLKFGSRKSKILS